MGYAVNSAKKISSHPDLASKSGEIIDAKYTAHALRNPPSLQALKLQDVLMKNAGGKIADECWHELPLATFKNVKGFRNLTHEDVVRLFEELRGVTMRHMNHEEGHTAVYGMIAVGRVDTDEGSGKLRYKFDDEFRKVIDKSNLYAVLDYRSGLAMSSRYAHRLHEMITYRAGRDKQFEKFSVDDLRAHLGVQTGKLARWPDFKVKALDAAISEINQLSRFSVSYRVTKRERRKTAEIELTWEVREALDDAKKEQAAHSVARKGRRAEVKENMSFPASGRIYDDTVWYQIKRDAGCNMDNGMIADKFRKWCAERQPAIRLDAKSIDKYFISFCKSIGKV
jgi:hypothetical protein